LITEPDGATKEMESLERSQERKKWDATRLPNILVYLRPHWKDMSSKEDYHPVKEITLQLNWEENQSFYQTSTPILFNIAYLWKNAFSESQGLTSDVCHIALLLLTTY
jgi:hypothetical protein